MKKRCQSSYKVSSFILYNIVMINVKVSLIDWGVPPVRKVWEDAYYEIRSRANVVIPAHSIVEVPTWVILDVPFWFYTEVLPVRVNEWKWVIAISWTVGRDWTWEVSVQVLNYTGEVATVNAWDKIAQIWFHYVEEAQIEILSSVQDENLQPEIEQEENVAITEESVDEVPDEQEVDLSEWEEDVQQ